MCLSGVLASAGLEYLTGLGLGVSGDSGTRWQLVFALHTVLGYLFLS